MMFIDFCKNVNFNIGEFFLNLVSFMVVVNCIRICLFLNVYEVIKVFIFFFINCVCFR